MLSGDNKFLCAPCDKKRDTLKRTCISRLPNVLILHLKRFEFDMEQMRKVKVNDKCDFPLQLDMRPFTKEGLERDPTTGDLGGHEGVGSAGEGYPRTSPDGRGSLPMYPDSYYKYKLAGVLVHQGTADSGHYFSYIKQRNTQVPSRGWPVRTALALERS